MIRIARHGSETLEDDLARRIVAAIDAGLYRVHPKGPATIGRDGTIGSDPVSWWTDSELDLVQAAGTLRWHPTPRGEDDRIGSADDDRGGRTTISFSEPGRLPEIRLAEALDDWIDHDAIAPGRSVEERIAACEPLHLLVAREAIAAPSATDDEADRIERLMGAVGVSAMSPEERTATVRVIAGNAWAEAHVDVMDEDMAVVPLAEQPDEALLALLPRCVDVHVRTSQGGIDVEHVAVDDYETWLDPEDAPDPVETMRILAAAGSVAP
jgi:hypothetical protein